MLTYRASQMALVVNNPPASVGDTKDMGSIPGLGDPLEKDMVTYSISPCLENSWIEESGRLQSMESQRVGHN